MSDAAIIAIAAGINGVVIAVVTSAFTYLLQKLKGQQEAAARGVIQVTQTLKEVKEDSGKILTHVNDQYLVLLRTVAEQAETVALLNPTETNRSKADEAQKVYQEHKVKQEAAAASVVAVQKEHAGIAREQLAVQKQIEENTDPAKVAAK